MVTKDLRGILECGLRGGTGVWSQGSLLGEGAHRPLKQEITFRYVLQHALGIMNNQCCCLIQLSLPFSICSRIFIISSF